MTSRFTSKVAAKVKYLLPQYLHFCKFFITLFSNETTFYCKTCVNKYRKFKKKNVHENKNSDFHFSHLSPIIILSCIISLEYFRYIRIKKFFKCFFLNFFSQKNQYFLTFEKFPKDPSSLLASTSTQNFAKYLPQQTTHFKLPTVPATANPLLQIF